MRISSVTKATSAIAAGILAFAALVPGTAMAIEHGTTHVDTGKTTIATLEVGDVHQVRGVLGLQCVVAKDKYLVSYRGTLPMDQVVAKWNELKQAGKDMTALFGMANRFDGLFNALKLTGTFEFSFKVDPNAVDVDPAVLTDFNAWKTAYEAANAGTMFPQHMILDTTKPPTYVDGKITVYYTLKQDLTAGELDTDYQTLKELNIDSPAGLLSVKQSYFKDILNSTGKSFIATEPRVEGKFNTPTTSVGGMLGAAVTGAMNGYFPITFDQSDATSSAPVTSYVTFGIKPQYASTVAGEMLPQEVMDTLPATMVGMIDPMPLGGPAQGTTVMAMNPTTHESEKWEFQGWPTASYDWNDDVTFADCRVAQPVGLWKKMPKADKNGSNGDGANASASKPKLAKTGADVAFQTAVAAVVLMAGAGLVVLRKRETR